MGLFKAAKNYFVNKSEDSRLTKEKKANHQKAYDLTGQQTKKYPVKSREEMSKRYEKNLQKLNEQSEQKSARRKEFKKDLFEK